MSADRLRDALLVARPLQLARGRRRRWLPGVSDGGWEILLALLCAQDAGLKMLVKSAALASGRPHTTGLRELERLEAAGLIARAFDGDRDKRRIHVGLTGIGRARTCGCLLAMREVLAGIRVGAGG